ncbi:hypothetical protein RJ640_025317 [Escallonia rubra]|uniref:Ionotropic glutamate receptor C-terminal domain-containing protein n=1 Tax=Escallonia rubra TaxID=112253 RepID=A0AA88QAS8_9ASTE|nr:hypothetical protein RJ640_025317 [Escallonia rubra]
MEIRKNKRMTLTFLVVFSLVSSLHALHDPSHKESVSMGNEIPVGVILDMGSFVGKTVHSCITMAISDFYALNSHYKTRIVLHVKDSKGEPLRALSTALDLLENNEVQAIIGPETSLEAKLLALLGDKAKLPILSLAANPSPIAEHPYFVQITQDETTQFEGIAEVIQSFQWRDVVLIYEDSDYGTEAVPKLVDSFEERSIRVTYRSAISPLGVDDQILEELHTLMTMQTTTFVMHVSPSLASSIFQNARMLGMMSEGYAWIVTDKTMNILHSLDSEVVKSMDGVLGFKSYIPASSELRDLTMRWRKEYYAMDPTMDAIDPNIFGLWAYDAVCALAKAVEMVGAEIPQAREHSARLNLTDFNDIGVSQIGEVLLNELSKIRFKGLSGEFQLTNGKLITNSFEIVNVIGKGERRVGFWTPSGGITKEINPISAITGVEAIIWPGGSTTTPKGWMVRMSGKKLRIVIPKKRGFKEFINYQHDPQTNVTTATGFCVDVLNAAIEALPYDVPYEFIPFVDANGQTSGTYNDLVYQVYLQNYDAVVGDVTINANRSLYVDFTLPFTDLGVGTIAKIDSRRNMWFFLEPLDTKLWLFSAGSFILTGFVVWVIEHPTNEDFQGEKLSSNWSKFMVIVWLFVVLILTSSYTATLSSLLTVQQIQSTSGRDNIGYQGGSFMQGNIVSNLNFKDGRLKPYFNIDEYADALSAGSKNGGVAAIVDEIPYIKSFLAKYSANYAMIASESTTNGFGFVFRKGSPLVHDMSREIAKLREAGKLIMMEHASFKSANSFMPQEYVISSPIILNFDGLRGLFFISFVSSVSILLIFLVFFIRARLDVKDFILRILAGGGLLPMLMYFSTTNVGTVQEINAGERPRSPRHESAKYEGDGRSKSGSPKATDDERSGDEGRYRHHKEEKKHEGSHKRGDSCDHKAHVRPRGGCFYYADALRVDGLNMAMVLLRIDSKIKPLHEPYTSAMFEFSNRVPSSVAFCSESYVEEEEEDEGEEDEDNDLVEEIDEDDGDDEDVVEVHEIDPTSCPASMEIRKDKQMTLSFLLVVFSLLSPLHAPHDPSHEETVNMANEIPVGVILDMGSFVGKTARSCITMAISNFYALNNHYKTRIVLHVKDSKGEPLRALSTVRRQFSLFFILLNAALDLLENNEVQAIIGPETSLEAKLLALLGDKAKLPILSLAANPSPIAEHPYFVQITQDETTQFEGIAEVIQSFQWRDVVLIYEDSDYGTEAVPKLVDSFEERSIRVTYRSAISPLGVDDQILEELHRLMTMQTTTFVVHVSPSLASSIFQNARLLGMMSEGYAWIVTDKTMNILHSLDSEVVKSMDGVLGFKSYIPASSELRDLTMRWRKKYYAMDPTMDAIDPNIFGLWAYDAVCALAKAVEMVGAEIPQAREHSARLNLTDFNDIGVSQIGEVLLNELSKIRFKGLSGEFQLTNGKLITNSFEIVNVIGKGERRVGFWTPSGGITKEINPISAITGVEAIIWPGGSTTTPKGWMVRMSGKKLRIVIPKKRGFKEFINYQRDPQTNVTTATGFCVDVLNAAIEALPYDVPYEFIPFVDANGQMSGTYNDLVYQVYLQNYDVVVGDVTINANRSLYVDFTLPFTDLGVGTIAKIDSRRNMWFFLEPLDTKLWLVSAGSFILTGFVVWVIEHPTNEDFQGSPIQQVGTVLWFSFSTLVYAHREKLSSNWSKFMVIVWLFVVLILTSSYTATLSSLLTVQQIQSASGRDNIGYQGGSFIQGNIVSNLNFKDDRIKPYFSIDEYADALSAGSKNGGVAAIVDEIPYIKSFLAKYSANYAMIASESTTSGFGFVFRKGSPLVNDMSREISKLREAGKLIVMEQASFKSANSLMPQESVISSPITLNFDSLRGLFLISFVSSVSILLIFLVFFIRAKLNVKDFILRILAGGGLLPMLMYFSATNVSMIQEINAS